MAEGARIFEELPEGPGQVVVLLGQRLIVHLGEEGRFLLVLGRSGDKVDVGFQIKPLLVCQHIVPDVAAAAERLFKQLRLSLGGIEPGLDGGKAHGPFVRPVRFRRHFPSTSFPRFQESVLS